MELVCVMVVSVTLIGVFVATAVLVIEAHIIKY